MVNTKTMSKINLSNFLHYRFELPFINIRKATFCYIVAYSQKINLKNTLGNNTVLRNVIK